MAVVGSWRCGNPATGTVLLNSVVYARRNARFIQAFKLKARSQPKSLNLPEPLYAQTRSPGPSRLSEILVWGRRNCLYFTNLILYDFLEQLY